MFTVEVRTNRHDIPTPPREELEYVVKSGKYLADLAPFPYTDDGKRNADRIARLLNNVELETRLRTQRTIRDALGMSR